MHVGDAGAGAGYSNGGGGFVVLVLFDRETITLKFKAVTVSRTPFRSNGFLSPMKSRGDFGDAGDDGSASGEVSPAFTTEEKKVFESLGLRPWRH